MSETEAAQNRNSTPLRGLCRLQFSMGPVQSNSGSSSKPGSVHSTSVNTNMFAPSGVTIHSFRTLQE